MTRLGKQALRDGIAAVSAGARLGLQLQPRIAGLVERRLLLGEFELAIFAEALKPESGSLTDAASERGEQVATMELLKGAIGVFKNRSSRRAVDYDDPDEAAEIVLLADLLRRILDRVEVRVPD